MARTRTQIKTAVDANTGRGTEKASLIETLCDEALKVAGNVHAWRDARSTPADITITEDATTVSISAVTGLIHIVSARIVQADGTLNAPLIMKDDVWWAKHVVNAEDNQKGWPSVGLRSGTNVLLSRPAESNLELRLRVTTDQVFATDGTANPIPILDMFITQYVTAFVFLSIQDGEAFTAWHRLALGYKWNDQGVPGGSLVQAINSDKYDLSEEMAFEPQAHRHGIGGVLHPGMSVLNNITDHDNYGGTAWYTNVGGAGWY